MNKAEILLAYKAGKLTTTEAQEKLHALKKRSLRKPLSEGQKGLWILQKMSPGMSAYNVPVCFKIGRKLDLEKFQRACRFMLEQYPILTTIIEEDNGVPYQVFQPSQPLLFHSEDISKLDSQEVLPYLRRKIKAPFLLQQGPLMRVHVLSRSEQEQIILFVIHHIIFDGSSIAPFIKTLFDAYQDLARDKNPAFIPLSTSYNDYVEWEREMLASNAGEEHRLYWEQQLSGTLPVLELTASHPRPAIPSFEGQVCAKLLAPELGNQIKAFTGSQSINRSVVFLGIFMVLLHGYTNQDDIIVGLPTMGRLQERFSSLIGYFINMIPIRGQAAGTKSFPDFIRELQLTLADGLDHAGYPFPAMVRTLNVPRKPGNSPVFQVVFMYQNFFQPTHLQHFQEHYPSLHPFEFVEGIYQEGEYELELEVYEQGDAFALNFKFNPDLFTEAAIQRMMGHYINLTGEIMNHPNLALAEYSFLSREEEKMILVDWNATDMDYPRDKCIHELFEQQVQKTPDAIAVSFEEETLTYRELDERSAQLAIYLQWQGIRPDCLVGICVDRHCGMIVGLLGILKAGGAYVPLEPGYPTERLEYMIQNSQVSLMLTQSRLMDKISRLAGNNLKIVAIDDDWAEIEHEAKAGKSLKREVRPNHLAYVIYTSGSTGKPKGVMIPHQAVTNFLISMSQKPGLNSRDKLLAVTTYCFDIAGLEIYLPLINGAKVYICGSERIKDVEKLRQEIQKYQPTIMQATPVTWAMLFQTGWKNEERVKILCGGEALPENLKRSFMDMGCELWNMFGPTETTIWSTVERISKEESITIGKPIANTQCYILDRNFRPVPIGVPGELCIAGHGLARGYLNQPELTRERFVENPFQPGTRLYKTGDLARWTVGGKIEFLGRIDNQVKIRGYRIELGEIESQLKDHPEIHDCAVIVKEQAEHKQLAAFYISKKPLAQEQIRAYAKSKLPEYMIPAWFIAVDKMPLTPNGKLDRKELMNRAVTIKKTGTRPDKSYLEIEQKVLEIWKDVLHTDNIGLEDGFFDVGGDSFLAVTVAQRIKDCFGYEFSVTGLFQYTNIKEICNYIIKTKDALRIAQRVEPRDIGPEIAYKKENLDIKASRRIPHPDYYQDSLAVIGISCHFPGAKNHLEFWNNLREGKESVKFFSKEELYRLNLPKEVIENPNFIPVQAAIEEKDRFDPGFFNISPRDAEYMDPQFRLLLLHSWKAFEDAGYVPKLIPETSVFMSTGNNLYQALLSHGQMGFTETGDHSGDYVSWVLAQGGTIPTMISYKLGFKGPSYFIHSNCSSALVGLYSAYQGLRSGEAKCALVGAASISPLSTAGYLYEAGLNLSGDGHVKTFDATADGMITGEGAAVILVKKAVDAIQDGDHIYALLRGISVNNDGADKVGFYAPSVKGQAEVIRKALESTQVHPETIGYIEAHGTGTKLGDPIELAALHEVYRQYSTKKEFCGIGSVKANIGHLDTAAGLAGLIKVVLSLSHREIPPSINYKNPNPNFDFKNSPFYVVTELQKWENVPAPRRAALSSFGIGGTNTHAIFEEYPAARETEPVDPGSANDDILYLIPLSAKTDDRLKAYAQELLDFLKPSSSGNGEPDRMSQLKQAVKRDMLEYLSALINIDKEEIDTREDFFELNVDYVQLNNILRFLQDKWNIELNWNVLIQSNSVTELINQILAHHSSGLTNYYQPVNVPSTDRTIVQPDIHLAQLTYTLQVGREAMESRVIFMVKNSMELIRKLEGFIGSNEEPGGYFTGKVKQSKDTAPLFENDEPSKEIIQKWLTQKQEMKLAQLWVKGFQIDWDLLYPGPKPRRISLPTYSFARESYRIPERLITAERCAGLNGATGSATTAIHPLLHQNTSDLTEQRYCSTFTGREFFMADYVGKGRRTLPGEACLEMARAAVMAALGTIPQDATETGRTMVRLQNVVWGRPIVIGEQAIQVHIGLYPEDNGIIHYQIYSLPDQQDTIPFNPGAIRENDLELTVHCQGSAVLSTFNEVPTLDLQALQTGCAQSGPSASETHQVFRMPGSDYGPGYQGILEAYRGTDRILAKLSLPSALSDTIGLFVLHPCLMDSVLQAASGLMAGSADQKPVFALTLQELEIFGKCASSMWALIRYSGNRQTAPPKLDIDLCDEQGLIKARFVGIEMQPVLSPAIPVSESRESFELMTYEEVWEEQTASHNSDVPLKTLVCFLSDPENQQAVMEAMPALDLPNDARVVFISQNAAYRKLSPLKYEIAGTDGQTYKDALRSIREDALEYSGGGEVDAILYLWPLEEPGCLWDNSPVVYILQAIASTGLKTGKLLLAGQYKNGLERCYLESWIGFERSLALAQPHTQVAVVYQEIREPGREPGMKDWLLKLRAELGTPKAQSVLYQEGKRRICRIRPLIVHSGGDLLRPGGAYLITGGCGELGFLFAKHFAGLSTSNLPVNLILTGRSPADAGKQSKIKALEALGSQVLYIQADICDPTGMKEGLRQARECFGEIRGVIHAAGLQSSQSIFGKEIHSFQQVLGPKVKGTMALDELLREEPLDFICYFSSAAAILGDFGSCDYAVGNRFLMAYAHYRNQLLERGECRGKAIAINWPLWKDGGMGFGDGDNTKMYLKSSGQRFLEAGEGVAMFDRLIAGACMQNIAQALVLAGQSSRVQRFLGMVPDSSFTSSRATSSFSRDKELNGRGRRMEMKGMSPEQCLEWDLKEHIRQLLKISRDQLDRERNLADFGFDSIRLTELAARLTRHYGFEITPALFFGYSTIDRLIQYFLQEHQGAILEFYRDDHNALEAMELAGSPTVPVTGNLLRPWAKKSRYEAGIVTPDISEPIAIIGMSGRFPGARNIDELWMILAAGQDMVQDIPAERFGRNQSPGINGKCGCVPGVDEFEPLFFEISPKEAETMDPRQRLLLQESWKALEDAGYGTKQIIREKIGMFVGAEQGDYPLIAGGEGSITSNHNAILASRLAYYLNLNGPVMAIDTSCSSGLVAAHQAILSLRVGECDTAIVAGVNLLLAPESFTGLSRAGMLSEDGKCFAFDKRASGMVPGEAVAVVIFKRLSRAKADGDPVYAVVKGSGINYDGKTNGITAPNGTAQTSLLRAVYDQYRINPEEIGYIVAHGTGTRLGDPVEINALNNAFKNYTRKSGYCAITSTKTNFGHTFAASGLVSLISLVQAIRHETIPASLHCEQKNDYIQWKESPFYINKTTQPWPCAFKEGAIIPRTGAVSAFGMSGTNAHMVVQSYSMEVDMGSSRRFGDQVPCFLLVFSAKTQEALEEKIGDMITILQCGDFQDQDLPQISYTLLEGRQHFNYRLAIVIQDRSDAVYGLKQAAGKEKLPNLFQGKVPRDFSAQKAMSRYAQDLLDMIHSLKADKPKYQEILYALAGLYCQGYEPDWRRLYGEFEPRRIHLATYPFAREHYWVPEDEMKYADGSGSSHINTYAPGLHPLLHQNISDVYGLQFGSTFTGGEFFLSGYRMEGQQVLPGVVCLEMARAAVQAVTTAQAGEASTQTLKKELMGIRLKDVVWARPMIIGNQPYRVNIGLYPEDNGEIFYEIYGLPHECGATGNRDKKSVIYSQGKAIPASVTEAPTLDLKAIQARCNQNTLSSMEVYDAFQAMGIEYQQGYRGIERLYIMADQVLAKLLLPASVLDTQDQFTLHPSIMDSGLQASIWLLSDTGDAGGKPFKPALPFTLQELEIFGRCVSNMWAVIRYHKDMRGGEAALDSLSQVADGRPKLDIDLCNEQGIVCVRMKGYSSKVVDGDAVSIVSPAVTGMLMVEPVWKEQAVAAKAPALDYTRHLVIFCGLNEAYPMEKLPESLEMTTDGVPCVSRWLNLQFKQKGIDKRFQNYAIQVFDEIQKLLNDKSKGKALVQIAVPFNEKQPLYAGLAGLLKTAKSENPKLIGQLIEVDPEEDIAEIIAKLKENACAGRYPGDQQIRYQDGKRMVARWSETGVSGDEVKLPWKDGGIYLITGGAGALGLIFAGEITRQAHKPVLILTGRTPLDEKKQLRFKELEEIGAVITYRQVDVTDRKGITELIQSIREEYGKLDGVIHGAGVIRDNYIIKKPKNEFLEVLGPKVTGLVNLDESTKEFQLDFFIIFSSLAGALGNPGQADYATANAFMDDYAAYRNRLVNSNQRYGRTLAVNWPLWQEGGMHVDQETEKLMLQNTGMAAMRTPAGIRAMYQALASGKERVMVMEGDLARMRELFSKTVTQLPSRPMDDFIAAVEPEQLRQRTLHQLKVLFGEVTRLEIARIDSDEPLESYGIDSFMIIRLNPKLEAVFGELPKTLFYEYQTLGALTEYLTGQFPQECAKWSGIEDWGVKTSQSIPEAAPSFKAEFPVLTSLKTNSKPDRRWTITSPDGRFREPVAIIGLSGRYPQAGTLQEFWYNLAAGKDSITEITEERWPLAGFYHPDPMEAAAKGKSYCKWGGFIDGFTEFDPLFFNISPREAFSIDPQERLFIQSCWEVFEDAGYTRKQLAGQYHGRVGVFAGITKTGFNLYGPGLWKNGESMFPNTSFGSVANRISYLLNLQGPSMPVDTMCSASLTAIHEACEHLLHGECELAIAGGVNLYLHPVSYIGLCLSQMLSTGGRCKSFGKGGDGFVPGEGVGAILLKPLSRAIADQDHIYAVIRGTSINHGGKTNGYTVPNPGAQGELIRTALDKAGVNARTVSYIEAHGTGTELGDPIEITGLTQAFRKDTDDTGYCAIGSVKSNIGHLEAAAGIAGLTKIILQMKYGQLVPSLHAKELNPNIIFAKTPFTVQQELTEWKRPVVAMGGEIREYPRIAGISSFGAGGANAHVVLQEYIPEEPERRPIAINIPNSAAFATQEHAPHQQTALQRAVLQRAALQRAIIVLSAKNEDRLREQARLLLAIINEQQLLDDNLTDSQPADSYLADSYLADIAYTLQVGREAMEERLGMVVGSIKELEEKLKKFLTGQDSPVEVYRGQAKDNKEALHAFNTDEELQEAVLKWIERKKYDKLLEFWVKGLVFDWNKLYGRWKPRRISLPTYPFARESYWIPENYWGREIDARAGERGKSGGLIPGQASPQTLHPLLHENTSSLMEQQFTSVFTGEEFFLKDHVIEGWRVLPGVAYLEMARAAVTRSIAGLGKISTGIQLKNVVWARPIVVGEQPVRIHIGLYPRECEDEIAYEIYSSPLKTPQHGSGISGENDMEPVVYSQGSATFQPITGVPTVDLKGILSQCNQGTLSAADIYKAYQEMGINYGPGHQGIETVYVGTDQLLAKLSLPSGLWDSQDQFVLHPSIMDSALQSSLAFMIDAGDSMRSAGMAPLKPAVPFALQELVVFGKCVPTMWALIRNSNAPDGHANHGTDKLQKIDIDLCDEQGVICIRMKGYSSRVLDLSRVPEGEVNSLREPVTTGTLLLEPVWNEPKTVPEIPAPDNRQHLVILCELDHIAPGSIQTQMNGVRCRSLQSKRHGIAQKFQAYAGELFEVIQTALNDKTADQLLIQLVISGQNEQQLFSGLLGLLKTAQLENPKLAGQVIEIEPADYEGIIAILHENACYPMESRIRYQNGKRMVAGWSEAAISPVGTSMVKAGIPWKDRGVYLITGGAGGLGMVFAADIADKAKEAAIILTGRSPLDSKKQNRLRELELAGIKVIYRQLDVTDRKAVAGLIQNIAGEFGSLHGIIHSAGVIKDNFIIKKDAHEFMEVLAPKVTGLVNLDEASRDMSLDFFVLFSSTAGSFGNPGQADYSTANAFMDAYAGYRNRLVAGGRRHGHTLSVNWPLWQEGGMHVDAETEKLMMGNSGLIPMRTITGIQVLYHGLATGKDRIMALEGNLKRLRAVFTDQLSSIEAGKSLAGNENRIVPMAVNEDLLQEKTVNYFKKLIASAIGLPEHRVETDAPLEKYGIDSVMVMQLTNELEKSFGSLSKTLFFEYQTIRELTGYFLRAYRNQLTGAFGVKAEAAATKITVTSEKAPVAMSESVSLVARNLGHPRFGFRSTSSPEEKTTGALDIAIIGVSGRYPGARNIQEFWQNLRDGRDCVTEIPKDRWDHSLYFDEDKNKPGKTYSKWGGFLEGVAEFDPLFFNISPREAEFIDPQERLFLECVYETLEDAGYTRQSIGGQSLDERQGPGLEGNVGVYVGVMYEEYQLYGAQEQIQGRFIALSGNPSSIANRVSYFCNFHGPSIAVDTMCSSSLTAIHLACQSLQRGSCEAAIAGGVNVSIHPNKYLSLAQGRFVSSKGRCESFGEGGDGYVPGEGVGAVLLKPLEKAIADGDHIYGVIKGTAVNHGGKTNGYSVPNPNAQAWVIGQALKEAGIDPRTISYIEAHGTGTVLGDPIEITGLTKAFREYTSDNQFCAIGSAKSNIGHCESAAGIAGVTKVLLQLKNQQLAPSLHSEILNPNIDFGNTPFIVQQTLTEWKRPLINGLELPRRAGVSSFGAGGSNAHVVIEEYISKEMDQSLTNINRQNSVPPAMLQPAALMHAIIVLSAKNEERLREQARRLLAAINEWKFTDAELDSIAYTLQTGREAMEERLGMVVGSLKELDEKLRGFIEGQDSPGDIYRGQVKGNKETLNVFNADVEMQEAIDKWIQRGKYAKLLELWVKGLIFDWNKLYGKNKPRRISLPTYPFANESYWFPKQYWSNKTSISLERESQTGNLSPKVSPDNSRESTRETPVETVMLAPVWDVVPVVSQQRFPSATDQLVVVGGTKENHRVLRELYPKSQQLAIQSQDTMDSIAKKLEALGTVTHILWIAPYHSLQSLTENGLIEDQNQGALQVFRMIKALLGLGYGNRDLGLNLITIKTQSIRKNEGANPTHASLYGLVGSLAKEYPNWKIRVVDLEPGVSGSTDWPVADIFSLPPDPGGEPLVYRQGKWYRQQLLPIRHPSLSRTLYRKQGVYVVIGGAGGIGEAWSEYMIRTYQANVIWIGRRPKDTAIQAKLDRLAGLGPAPGYIAADATDPKALQQAYETIKERHAQIHGVIHSAIVLLDRSLQNMDEERFRSGLAAKVDVSVRLAQVFQKEPLDFVLFFSSLQSFSKAPGQSNYAAGCTFKDAFARQLALEWRCPVKVMNWGYWGSVGIVASKVYQERMAKAGLGSIEAPEAMAALEILLAGPLDQVVFLKTTKQRVLEEINIEELMAVHPENPALNIQNIQKHIPATMLKQVLKATDRKETVHKTTPSAKEPDSNRSLRVDNVAGVFQRIASQLLNVKGEDIDIDAQWSEYGFDPLLFTEFMNRLNRNYLLELTPALFSEYPTLQLLAEYLVETYGDVLTERLQQETVL
jgi:polyketide synthase PksN